MMYQISYTYLYHHFGQNFCIFRVIRKKFEIHSPTHQFSQCQFFRCFKTIIFVQYISHTTLIAVYWLQLSVYTQIHIIKCIQVRVYNSIIFAILQKDKLCLYLKMYVGIDAAHMQLSFHTFLMKFPFLKLLCESIMSMQLGGTRKQVETIFVCTNMISLQWLHSRVF